MKKKSPLIQYNAPTTLNFALLSFAVLVIGIVLSIIGGNFGISSIFGLILSVLYVYCLK